MFETIMTSKFLSPSYRRFRPPSYWRFRLPSDRRPWSSLQRSRPSSDGRPRPHCLVVIWLAIRRRTSANRWRGTPIITSLSLRAIGAILRTCTVTILGTCTVTVLGACTVTVLGACTVTVLGACTVDTSLLRRAWRTDSLAIWWTIFVFVICGSRGFLADPPTVGRRWFHFLFGVYSCIWWISI